MRRAGKHHVGDITAAALDQSRIFEARDRLADSEFTHCILIHRHARLTAGHRAQAYIDLAGPSIGPDSALRCAHDRATADRNVRSRPESPRRRHGGCLHALRQMRRGLPGHGSRRPDGEPAAKSGPRHRRHHRHRAPRRGQRRGAQMGERVPLVRRMHQGLRLRRQSALPALYGAHRDGARQGDGGAAPRRRRSVPQGRASR